jgi:hypothetical protein
MAANDLVITITARDQATEHLKNVRQEMRQTALSGESLERAFALPAGSVNVLREGLERLSGAIPGLAGSFRGLGAVMTSSVGGAATGLVAAVTTYGLALNRVADDQARFQRVLHSLDAGAIRGELARVTDEMNKMADVGNRIGNQAGTWTGALQSFLSRLQALPQAARETFLGAPTPEAQRAEALTILGGVLGAQEGAKQTQLQAGIAGTQQRALLFQQQRRLNAEDLEGFLALQPQLEAADKRERDLALRALQQRQGLETAAAIKEGLPLGPIQDTQRLQRQQLEGELEISLARQKLAREEQARALVERRITQFQGRPIEGIEEVPRFEGLTAGVEVPELQMEAIRQRLFKIESQAFVGREAAPEPGIQEAARFEGVAPGTLEADTLADAQKAVNDANERSRLRTLELGREAIAVEQELIELQGQSVGLTQSQRDALQLSISAQREQLKLADLTLQSQKAQTQEEAVLLDRKKELVAAQEAMFRSSVEQRRLEREDPIAGLAAGQREIDESAAAAGDRLRTAYVSAYHDISQGFTDIVVDGLTNQGDKIGDIGKQMGKRLLAGFVDQISQSLFSKVFSSLGSVFGVPSTSAARPLATAVPLLASPFAAAGTAGATGTATVSQAGGAGGILGSGYLQAASGGEAASAATITPGVATQAASVAGTGVGILGDAVGVGKALLSGFAGPTLSAYGVIAAYNAGGLAGVAAAQALVGAGISEGAAAITVAATASEGGAAIGIGGSSALGAGTAPAYGGGAVAGIGATAASVAGGVLAAAALAYTAYSAYQSADIAGGAIGGAVSGAALGTAIYPGVGTVVGLIAGAAIGAGAGAAGKEEQEIKGDRLRNEADRQRRGSWVYQDLMNAIQTGIDHEDIAQQTVRTGDSVGGLLMGVAAANQSGAVSGSPWGWPPSENAKKALTILAGLGVLPTLDFQWDRINSTMELIATWHNPRGVTEGDIEIAKNAEALMAAFVNKQGATVFIGFDEQGDTGLRGSAGNVTRTTLLRSDRAREAAGQDIFVVGGSTRGLEEDQLGRLTTRLLELDRDRILQTRQFESDSSTYVTTGQTTAAPPPQPAPPPDLTTLPFVAPDVAAAKAPTAPAELSAGILGESGSQVRGTDYTVNGPGSPYTRNDLAPPPPPEAQQLLALSAGAGGTAVQPLAPVTTAAVQDQPLEPVATSTTQRAPLTDDEAQQLLQQLVRVDRNRDLRILNVETGFGATVTIGA